MILVLLGTFPTEFSRPLIAIEELCKAGLIQEEIIVQNGHTSFDSEYMTLRPFIPPNELTELYLKARFIISHAGSGSIIKGIKLNKKLIAIARLANYNEVVDNHQVEILNEFVKLNYILAWNQNEQLQDIINGIEDFAPSPYISNKQNIINFLDEYLSRL